MKKDEKNINDPKNLPERFAENNYSLDNISGAEIMRYIITLCITRRNAPVDVDKICGRFESVRQLLFAPDEALGGEDGLSPYEIQRFRLIGSMFMRVRLERLGKKIKADNESMIAEYVSLLCMSHPVEVVYILPIVKNILKEPFLFSSGTEISVAVNFNGIVAVLKRYPDCKEFIITHNHPFNSSKPSGSDITATEWLFGNLYSAGYCLREHYVVGTDGVKRVPYEKNPLKYLFGDKNPLLFSPTPNSC